MDTYENDAFNEEPIPQQNEPEKDSEGFYHGSGAGVTEATLVVDESASASQERAPQPEQEPQKSEPKRHIGKKIAKCAIAGAVVLALVITGCGVSIGVVSHYWKNQNELLVKNFEERLGVLQQQLKNEQNQNGGNVIVTEDGLTPSQIYDKNINSVVAVNCVTQSSAMGQVYESTSAGSGFVLSADGYIVTNCHVISGVTSISVTFYDGTKMDAKLIGSDETNDIALLKVEATDLRPVTLGSSDSLKVGEPVVAIGNALGELSFSLTAGYVSGMNREITTDGTAINMIQTDVAINSGNSGGPLFNSKGEVVGITSAKYSGTTSSGASIEGISFAIPIDDVSGMLDDLRQYGYIRSAYLGIMAQELPWDSSYAEAYGIPLGVYVKSVTANGSADKAGIQARDIITNVGGYEVESMNDLSRALRAFEAGDKATIELWRQGRTVYVEVVFDEKPQTT